MSWESSMERVAVTAEWDWLGLGRSASIIFDICWRRLGAYALTPSDTMTIFNHMHSLTLLTTTPSLALSLLSHSLFHIHNLPHSLTLSSPPLCVCMYVLCFPVFPLLCVFQRVGFLKILLSKFLNRWAGQHKRPSLASWCTRFTPSAQH